MSRGASATLIGVGGAIVAYLVFRLAAPYYATHFEWFFRSTLPYLIPALAVAIVVVFVLAVTESGGAAFMALVLGLAGFIAWCVYANYLQDVRYSESIREVTEPIPALAERGPYDAAQAQAQANMGANTGNLADTTYRADSGQWANLVAQRGWTTGYHTILEQQVPLDGRSVSSTNCDFSRAAGKRLGGNLGGNLGRAINSAPGGRGLSWDAEDAYGYCENGKPMVVVPLLEQEGIVVVTVRPAGVAVYDGETGQVQIRNNAKGLPGPVYPQSLSRTQVSSSAALNGLMPWVWNSAGWDTAPGTEDYNLASADSKRPLYVTPLAVKGSPSISSVAVVDAQSAADGGYAPVTVHRLNPSWTSVKAIENQIKGDYQDIPWQAGFSVLEVAPLSSDRWVATIGNGQIVQYRVTGTGMLTPGAPGTPEAGQATCLYDRGALSRCGSRAGVGGNGVGFQFGPGEQAVSAPVPTGELAGLSDQQLAELTRRVAEENAKRLTSGR